MEKSYHNALIMKGFVFKAAMCFALLPLLAQTQLLSPKNPSSIGRGEFAAREDLLDVRIPDGVESIGEDAFNGCVNLTQVALPVSVAHVGKTAFDKCGKLKTVVYLGTKRQWEELCCSDDFGVFNGFFLDAKAVCSDGVYEAHLDVTVKALGGKSETSEKQFMHRVDIRSVEVQEGIKTIGRDSFAECVNLTSVKLPTTLRTIDVGAFAVCSKLESVEIPQGTERIADWSFSDCWKLKEVTLPASLKRIDSGAFALCPRLETVRFKGSQEQWQKIKIAGGNEDLTRKKIVFDK